MGDEQPGVPAIPPKMEVGYNYPWAFNKYGTHIGPRDLENEPPTGAHSDVAVFRDVNSQPPEGSLARNLTFIRDELKIKKVRMFILGNCWNYGARPLVSKGVFFVPDLDKPAGNLLFGKHFREMLQVFAAKEMQIIPSLIDFGAFYELDPFDTKTSKFLGAGSGRTEIARKGRFKFLKTMFKTLLDISNEPGLSKTIFAWEVINEPRWNLVDVELPIIPIAVRRRPHTTTHGQDLGLTEMSVFIQDALEMIKDAGFQSTVGHRFLGDLPDMPVGTMPQFHYYSLQVPLIAQVAIPGDPASIPPFASLTGPAQGAFVGEFHSAVDRPWQDCGGADNSLRTATFERLKVLARKGYKLAFVWPDGGDEAKVNSEDALKLSPDSIESIKQFTRGLFPNGVP